ncbi:cysteine-rich CWC family protein [Vibrio navarrensis]|uniref:cysteine-rich CWC family protein n=1 Tax=Vibrio navarrensis TaxID=29495 RepID=UPI00051DBB42|nr:cysteine-rich CWC family protein [Vibrio navarrensis]KGK16031.1 hypothetical protein EA25_16835 [Vibrio navarrensis]
MKSACIGACKNNGGICQGCHRTMAEIVNWASSSDKQREHILSQLAGQEATHQCPSCRQPSHCDISVGKSTCWCFNLEEREIATELQGKSCLCRRCLEKTPLV